MASRRRRRTDSDNSGATVGEVSNLYSVKDESREDHGSNSSSLSRHDRSLEFSAIVRSIVQSSQVEQELYYYYMKSISKYY